MLKKHYPLRENFKWRSNRKTRLQIRTQVRKGNVNIGNASHTWKENFGLFSCWKYASTKSGSKNPGVNYWKTWICIQQIKSRSHRHHFGCKNRKENHSESPRSVFFFVFLLFFFKLFHYKPLVRPCSEHCLVLGIWPECLNTLPTIRWFQQT